MPKVGSKEKKGGKVVQKTNLKERSQGNSDMLQVWNYWPNTFSI